MDTEVNKIEKTQQSFFKLGITIAGIHFFDNKMYKKMLGTYFIPSLVRDVCHSGLTRATATLLRVLPALELGKNTCVHRNTP